MADTVQCHPGLIRAYRERRGWTQVELAVRAGFSERLVRKAEAGEPLRLDTVQVLAQALSIPAEPLAAADLVDDPLAVAQSMLRAHLLYGVDAPRRCAHLLDPNVVTVIHSDPRNVAFAGEFVGVEGMERLTRTAYDHVTVVHEEMGKWFTNGPRVAVLQHQVLRAKGVADSPEFQTWCLHEYTVEGGRIVRIDSHLDQAAYIRLSQFASPEARRAAEQVPPSLKPGV
jgi:transcriptional regulator with XRE-family HTH domain